MGWEHPVKAEKLTLQKKEGFFMPRKARAIKQNEYYHVIIRGNNRVWLFETDSDKQCFLEVLAAYCRRYKISIYHYCVMDNHVHLILRGEKTAESISKLMQGVQMVFARYYKKKIKMTGAIFEGRYKSYPIRCDEYLLECGRYIERNPVRAKKTRFPEDYRWSSYRFYAYGVPNKLLSPDPVYLGLSCHEKVRRQIYRSHVKVERAYEEIVDRYFEKVAVA